MTRPGSAHLLTHDVAIALGEPARAVLCEQLGYLHESILAVTVDDSAVHLELARSLDDQSRATLAAAIDELAARIERSFLKVSPTVVAENDGSGDYRHDPMPILRDTRQAIEIHRGVFVLRGDLLRVVNGLDHHFRAFALALGAEEQSYPTTVPLASMIANGYLANFPHHALLVSRVHAELPELARISAAEQVPDILTNDLVSAGQVLAPTVCYHCFEALRGSDIDVTGSLFTATARCHRHEGTTTAGLARLQTFTMREIIFFDGPAEVVERKQQLLDEAEHLFIRWEVGFEIVTATDPFFAVHSENKRAFQSLQELKHELRLKLPFDDSTLACASFNNHKNTLVTPYRISARDEGTLASGCSGYGLERMAFALFAQFGLDLACWPDSLRSDLAL